MDKIKAAVAWAIIMVIVLLLLVIFATGKAGIFLAVVLVPDDVAIIQ
jgi:hypothetical protein